MKSNTGLVVAIALLAVVSGVVGYLLYEDTRSPVAGPPPETRLFADNLNGLTRASLHRPGEEPLTLVQVTPPEAPEAGIGEWRITSPATYKADIMAVGEWLGMLRTLDAERLLDAGGEAATGFGFESPMLTIEFNVGESPRKLEIGAINPTGSARYARLSGAPKLYLLGVGSVTTLNKSLADLRQKRAFDVTEFSVDRVMIEAPTGRREILRTPTRDWTLASPAPFRGDQTAMAEFVTTIISARTEAEALARSSVSSERFRAMKPVATITAVIPGGQRVAEFRRDTDNTLYAKSDDLSGIYPVITDLEDYLKKPVEEFRNKKLFDFGFADVFTLKYKGADRELNLTKPNEQWLLDGKSTDSAKANKLLDELRSATGTAFVEGEASGQVAAAILIETAGGNNEQVELRRSGTACFAVRVGEKGYYNLSENVLQDIEKAAAEIHSGGNGR